MSWEAVAWANRQKMKKSYEQIILLVLANSADPDGEAFSKWPFKDHWWVYLSDHTRLSRASVFRHLKTIIALGLGERSMLVLADGSKRPTIKLNLAASFDIDNPADRARYDAVLNGESPLETDDDHDAEQHENGNDFNESQAETPDEKTESQAETVVSSLRPETGSVSVQRLHKDSNLTPIDSPRPPSGGVSAHDLKWNEFASAWGPIEKIDHARSAWMRLPTDKLDTAIAAAKGYQAWIKGQPKRTPQSAQSFLRAPAGFAQWLPFVPTGGAVPCIPGQHPATSREGLAIIALYRIAGLDQLLRAAVLRSDGMVHSRIPLTPQLLTLAEPLPPRDAWPKLTRAQAAAWEEKLLRDVFQNVATRQRLREGSIAPHPWPPLVTGRWPATGPPALGEWTDEEAQDFK